MTMVSISILVVLSFLSTSILADLYCQQYVPHGNRSNVGVLNFVGQNNESYIPSTNASIGHEVYLPQEKQPGTIFHFETCNSTSLNLGPSLQQFCSDPDCEKHYFNDIRIINHASGHCLTARLASNGLFALTPELCDINPTTTAQIFQTHQYVLWHIAYTRILYIGPTYLLPYGYNVDYLPENGSDPWVIGRDNKTLLYNPLTIGVSPNSLLGTIVI